MIKIRFPIDSDMLQKNIEFLCNLINESYWEAEEGILHADAKRVTEDALLKLLHTHSMLLAEIDNQIVGCVNIEIINRHTARFAMLVSNKQYRGMGIGRALVEAAEAWAFEKDCSYMCLELLNPKSFNHAHKEFLRQWYEKMGYVYYYTKVFYDETMLITPCNFLVYRKFLK